MNKRDRALLGILGATVALIWFTGQQRDQFGLPNLIGTGKKDDGGRENVPPAPKRKRASSTTQPGAGGSGGGKGSPYIEVTSPRIVGPK